MSTPIRSGTGAPYGAAVYLFCGIEVSALPRPNRGSRSDGFPVLIAIPIAESSDRRPQIKAPLLQGREASDVPEVFQPRHHHLELVGELLVARHEDVGRGGRYRVRALLDRPASTLA
jgi:hypothetical protein